MATLRDYFSGDNLKRWRSTGSHYAARTMPFAISDRKPLRFADDVLTATPDGTVHAKT
jgi:hypothetical protein